MIAPREPTPGELEAFMGLSNQEIARLVLCLLIEEALQSQLSAFRCGPEELHPEPPEGGEKLLLGGSDVVPVGHTPR